MNAPPAPPSKPSMPPPSAKPTSGVLVKSTALAFALPSAVPRAQCIVVSGVEGIGKTSLVANAPGVAIIQARGETGYQTLVSMGRVPAAPTVVADSWEGLLGLLDTIATDHGAIRTLALDALGGFERLCHEYVCAREFGGDWGEKGFGSFMRGYDQSVPEWVGMLNRLDKIREKGVNVILLSHVHVKPFKNPTGADFDRYEAACHPKTWGVTHKWADAVLFCTFRTITSEKKGKTKGIGGTERVAYTERRDAFDAKNRHGMPEELEIPNDPAEFYRLVSSYLTPAPKG